MLNGVSVIHLPNSSDAKQPNIRGVYTKKERLSFQPAAAVAQTTNAGAAKEHELLYSTLILICQQNEINK